MSRGYAVLSARIRAEIEDLDRVGLRVARAIEVARKAGEEQDVYLDSIALNLHDVYSGYERVFKLVAEALDDEVPEGSGWHRSLLATRLPDVMAACRADLERFLAFLDALDGR